MKSILFLFSLYLTSTGLTFSQFSEEWVRTYDGPSQGPDIAKAMVVDANGYIYITGQSTGIALNTAENTLSNMGNVVDYATIKYSPGGVEQWVARYNTSFNGGDLPTAIAVDTFGNVYVTGSSQSSSSNTDIATVKYNSLGVEQWARRFSGAGDYTDLAYAIKLDGMGNIYVAGSKEYAFNKAHCLTLKYNTDGVLQWDTTYVTSGSGYAEAFALAVDNSGNAYITGKSHGGASLQDIITIMYNPSGGVVWAKQYSGNGFGEDAASSIILDNIGNVIVAGKKTGMGTGFDFITIKYDPSGNELWAQTYNDSDDLDDVLNAVTVDGFGNIYVTGTSSTNASGEDYVTIKYNSGGSEQWLRRYNGTNNAIDKAYAIAIDSSNNIYVTGESEGSTLTSDYTTIRYTSDGVEQWVARHSGDNRSAYAYAIAAVGNSIYVTGGIRTVNYNFVTVKYSQVTGVEPIGMNIPKSFVIHQNYPNPFNPATTIRISVPQATHLALKVYNLLGSVVATVFTGKLEPGNYNLQWQPQGIPSGMYIYRVESGIFTESRKLVFLK